VLLQGIAELSEHLLQRTAHAYEDVLVVLVVGNPTMMYTFFGESPHTLGEAPYQGLWYGPRFEVASSLPIRHLSELLLVGGPMIRSHVGADLVAAGVATDLLAQSEPALLVDLGTNCELALWDGQTLWITSAPAGPAFEAAEISCGMRAEPGAIDHLALTPQGQVIVHIIGEGPAKGICGAGLMDVLAVLYETGGLDASGNLQPAHNRVDALEIQRSAKGPSYEVRLLANQTDVPVVLTQADVRFLQLAKSAIRSAIDVLLYQSRLSAPDLARIYLARAFGAHCRATSLMRIGVLPEGVPADCILSVGNAAGAGAVQMLCRCEAWERAVQFAQAAKYVELAGMTVFDELFVEHLQFPVSQ